MFRKGPGVFELREDEIQEILMADNSDVEDDLLLDEEDQKLLTQDDDQGIIDVFIEDTTLADSTRHEPSTTTAEPVTEAQCSNQPVFKWSQRTYIPNVFSNVEYEFGKVQICQDVQNALLTPFDIFCSATNFYYLVQYIVSESVRYAHQNGQEFTIEVEMKAFLVMNLIMGYHILPSLRDYWSTEPEMAVLFISNVMPRVRFEEIRRHLQFCNNETVRDTTSPDYDWAYKIRAIIEHLNASLQNALNDTEKQSIDEHMIKFKGHNAMKQYIKNKPVKWGFKLWCRCDAATGYLFEFDLYTGKKTYEIEYGLGGLVLQLTKKIQGLGCEIYMDNFFNSPFLQYKLIDLNTKACGTVRTNRKHLPKTAPADKTMKRGDIFTKSFHGISFVKWMENKGVHLLTNFLSLAETDTVKRRKAGSAEKK